jgi:hypothetical protein
MPLGIVPDSAFGFAGILSPAGTNRSAIRPLTDRLVHNAHRIEMRADSMRKNRGKQNS